MAQIRACGYVDNLKFFVLSGVWIGNINIRDAIQKRFYQLDPARLQKEELAEGEFWNPGFTDEELM